MAKAISKATNATNGGYGLFFAIEKHVKKLLHQGNISSFAELSKISENILTANICSNTFHDELEKFLIVNFTDENL